MEKLSILMPCKGSLASAIFPIPTHFSFPPLLFLSAPLLLSYNNLERAREKLFNLAWVYYPSCSLLLFRFAYTGEPRTSSLHSLLTSSFTTKQLHYHHHHHHLHLHPNIFQFQRENIVKVKAHELVRLTSHHITSLPSSNHKSWAPCHELRVSQ